MNIYYFSEHYDLQKAHASDAGYDLYANEDRFIKPMSKLCEAYITEDNLSLATPLPKQTVGTGIYLCMLDGYINNFVLVLPRSSINSTPLIVQNSPGLVDYDYTGEVKIALANIGTRTYKVSQGDKLAQLLLLTSANLTRCTSREEFDWIVQRSNKLRGDAGFGSTGNTYTTVGMVEHNGYSVVT